MQGPRKRRGKRSEPFWPSMVMKKWLNIKPKVHEFSEDEGESEDEAAPDKSVLDAKCNNPEDLVFRMEGSTDASPPKTTGPEPKVPYSRNRRGKSETLRIQYISKKDVRVMIGTWNVAGRVPLKDLDVDEWLCKSEPAEMYILGFQEVVPLNAGNVLGAEDSRPIPKWEAIIRRTLNKTSQPKTTYKSYSAPTSPVSRTLPASDTLANTKCALETSVGSDQTSRLDDDNDAFQKDTLNLENKLRYSNITNISSAKNLIWPESSLDSITQAMSTGKKLRRVMSSTSRYGFDVMAPEVHPAPCIPMNTGLKPVYQSSGKLGMLWSEQQENRDVLSSLNDGSDKLYEEEEEDLLAENVSEKSESGGVPKCSKQQPRYVRIVSKQMVGIYISVWVCRKLRRHIDNLKVSPVGVGLMGYMGNKGSVSVSMSLFQTQLCFVCSHLTSGHKEGDQQKRNLDVYDILQRTRFSSSVVGNRPQTIPSHDQIFWFGDLNYRLNLSDTEVRELVARKKWNDLMKYDQLSNELKPGSTFDGWKEGLINFAPTYKYKINSNRYVGANATEGEKTRSPAWCDRILWLGKGIKQLSYWSPNLCLSDHRPVSAIFVTELEIIDPWKLQKALNFTVMPPETIFCEEAEDEFN